MTFIQILFQLGWREYRFILLLLRTNVYQGKLIKMLGQQNNFLIHTLPIEYSHTMKYVA